MKRQIEQQIWSILKRDHLDPSLRDKVEFDVIDEINKKMGNSHFLAWKNLFSTCTEELFKLTDSQIKAQAFKGVGK